MPQIHNASSGHLISARVPSALPERLRFYRRLMGLTLDELAQLTGLARKTLGDLETKAQANPTFATLQKIAWALELPIAVLVEGLDLPPRV